MLLVDETLNNASDSGILSSMGKPHYINHTRSKLQSTIIVHDDRQQPGGFYLQLDFMPLVKSLNLEKLVVFPAYANKLNYITTQQLGAHQLWVTV